MNDNSKVVLNVRDIQQINLEMLDAFDRFCKEHDLSYSVCGGTLLGAVRHKGFIPWDDDLDLFMTRPEYDRLTRICASGDIAPGMTFACPQNGLFMRPFARVYYNCTSVERRSFNADSGAHVWMDILPVDGLPPQKEKWPRLYLKRKLMDHFVMETMWNIGTFNRKKDYIKRPLYFLIGCNFRGRKGGRAFWCKKLEDLGKRYPFDRSEYIACITAGRYGEGETMRREDYMRPATVEFEGRTLPAMGCWHEYLTGIYGDYMTPPPEHKRYPHLDLAKMGIDDYRALCERHPELAGHHPEAGL